MILRIFIHVIAVVVTVIATAIPAMYLAIFLAETGLLGECREGGCGYTALFLLFPIFWFVAVGAGVAIWARVYRKHLRTRLGA